MLRKLEVVLVLMCTFSYAAAEKISIGTAGARGDMQVDSHMVKGNATLFDGSVVETGSATADLRLDKGVEITMAVDSRGTLHHDRIVLQQGESELAGSSSFQIEANGLRVSPNAPNSRGVVSLKPGNTVEVAALNGSFGVVNEHGVLLASVRPGSRMSFVVQSGANPTSFTGIGTVSFEDGHYFFTSESDAKYELTCKNYKKYVGTKVQITGTVREPASPTEGSKPMLCADTVDINCAAGGHKWILAGVIVGIIGGTGTDIYYFNHHSNPASRP